MNENQPQSQKLLNSGITILFFGLLISPLGYLLRIVLSRSLSIEMYGLLYAVLSLFAVLAMFNDLGYGYALAYYIPKYFKKKEYAKCWNLYIYDQYIEFFTSLFISAILIFSSNYLSIHYFKHSDSKILIYLFCMYLIGNGIVSSIQKLLIGLQQEKIYSSIEFFRMFFTLSFSLFFFLFDINNIFYYATAFVVSYIFVAILFLIIVKLKFKYIITPVKWDKKLFLKSFKFGFPVFLSSSLYLLTNYTDVIFLTYFKDVFTVGIYSVILPIASISVFLFEPVKKMIIPFVSEQTETNKDKVVLLINNILRIVPFVGLYFGLFISLFSDGVISTTFGYKWVKLSSFYLKLMSISYIFSLQSIYLTTIVSGLGEIKQQLKISVFLTMLSLFTASMGAKYFGLSGVIASHFIIVILSLLLSFKIITKRYAITLPYKLYLNFLLIFLLSNGIYYSIGYVPISFLSILTIGVLYTILMIYIFFKLEIVNKQLIEIYKNKIFNLNVLKKFSWFNDY